MPYLQVDLDAMDKWPLVASGCSIKTEAVYKGFLDLWQFCWRQKSGFVGLLHLECLFDVPGRGERLAEVLCAFGFLEKRDGGLWVSGSEKYLRISEARSKGGKSAQKNLKRGKSPGSSRKPAGKQPEDSPGSGPALTASSEHHSASSKKTSPPETAEAPGYQELVRALFAKFRELRGKDPEPSGRDWVALKRLRARTKQGDAEIVLRWGRGLQGKFKKAVDSFEDLDARWDALAATMQRSDHAADRDWSDVPPDPDEFQPFGEVGS